MSHSENHGRFVWHELMTSDPKAAEKYYRDVVGWSAEAWGTGNHDYTVWSANGVPIGGMMQLTPDAAAMGAPPSWRATSKSPTPTPRSLARRSSAGR